jgi:hypothetical protein
MWMYVDGMYLARPDAHERAAEERVGGKGRLEGARLLKILEEPATHDPNTGLSSGTDLLWQAPQCWGATHDPTMDILRSEQQRQRDLEWYAPQFDWRLL